MSNISGSNVSMCVNDVLKVLDEKGIEIMLSGEHLSVRAPIGVMTPELKLILNKNKRALISLLRNRVGAKDHKLEPIDKVNRQRAVPLSFSQQRLWILDQYAKKSATNYSIPWAVRVIGQLDIKSLKRAFGALINRHETLRMRVECIDDEPFQAFEEMLSIDIPILHVTEKEVDHYLQLNESHYFNLSTGPLVKVCLLRLSSNEHVLMVNMHHIASDGWSVGIFNRELTALYKGYLEDREVVLEPLRIQYADYANWQVNSFRSGLLDNGLAYWRDKLEGSKFHIEFPTDSNAAQQDQLGGSIEKISCTSKLSFAIEEFAKKQGKTLFSVLMTGLNILIHKWCGETDIVVGTVVAGREHPETENLIGCFINFLALRTTLSSDLRAFVLLQQIGQDILEGLDNQFCPFELVVRELNPSRKMAKNPLFNIALLLQNYERNSLELEGLCVQPVENKNKDALLDLRFVAVETRNGLQIICEYDNRLFSVETVKLLLESYHMILEQLIEQPNRRLNKFNVSSELQQHGKNVQEERLQLVVASTFTADPLKEVIEYWAKKLSLPANVEFAPYNQVFQQLLDQKSKLLSNHEGINTLIIRIEDWIERGDTELCLEMLRETVNEYSQLLSDVINNSSANFVIVLCPVATEMRGNTEFIDIYKSIELELSVMCAQSKNGYLLTASDIDRYYPVNEYFDPVADKIAHVPFTDQYFIALGTMLYRMVHRVEKKPFKVIVVDCDNTLWGGVCGEVGADALDLSDPWMYLQQKILEQEQAGLLVCLCSKNNEEDVWGVFEKRADMILRRDMITAARINWKQKSINLKSLSEELNLGLDSFIFIDDDPWQCAEVRSNCPEVLTVQLPSDPDEIPKFLEHIWAFDHFQKSDANKSRTSLYKIERQRSETRKKTKSLSEFIGSLNLNISFDRLKDSHLERAAELLLRTNQFNFSGERYSQMELSSLLEQGTFQGVVTRVSDRFGDYGLVGLLLYKIERNRLKVSNLVLSCRALGRGVEYEMVRDLALRAEKEGLKKIQIKFVKSNKNSPAEQFIDELAADYRLIVNDEVSYEISVEQALKIDYLARFDDELEVTPYSARSKKQVVSDSTVENSDKCCEIGLNLNSVLSIENDMASIKALEKLPSTKTQYKPLTSDTEITVAKIWAELLNIQSDSVGKNDNFFDLGGHSLLAVKAISRIHFSMQVELNLKTFFDIETLEKLAQYIDEHIAENFDGCKFIKKAERDGKIPLSFAQERLWLLEILGTVSSNYNMAVAFKVNGKLNISALQKAYLDIVKRHETLRTNIDVHNGVPFQIIRDVDNACLAVEKISVIEHETNANTVSEDRLIAILKEDINRKFDLKNDRLFRMRLFEVSEGKQEDVKYVISIVMHHIISDEWSIKILVDEIIHFYDVFNNNERHHLSNLPIQYADYSLWQRSADREEKVKQNIRFWKELLCGAPVKISFPKDVSVVESEDVHKSDFVSFKISKTLIDKMQVICEELDTTLFTVLLAAYQLLLCKYSDQDEVIVGVPVVGRDRPEVQNIIGFFVNSLLIRTTIANNPVIGEYLKAVKNTFLDAYTHQDIPAEILAEQIFAQNRTGKTIDVQFAFNMLANSLNSGKSASKSIVLEQINISPERIAERELTLTIAEDEESSHGIIEYDTKSFHRSTIERMANHYKNLLQEIVENYTKPVKCISLISNNELYEAFGFSEDVIEDIYPLTAVQRDMFMDAIINPDTLQYCLGMSYRLKSAIDLHVWKQAISELTKSTDVLRTRFKVSDKSYTEYVYQCIQRSCPVKLNVVDFSNKAISEAEIGRYIENFIYQPFDFEKSDLVEHALVKVAKEDFIYVMRIYHGLFDGASLDIYWHRLYDVYTKLNDGHKLPEQKINNYSQYVYSDLEKTDTESVLDWWQKTLSDLSPLLYTTGDSSAARNNYQSNNVIERNSLVVKHAYIEQELWQEIKNYSRTNRITPALFFRCVFSFLVGVYCRANTKICIYEIRSDRSKELMDTLGLFFQKVPYVFDMSLSTVEEMFKSARDYQRSIKSRQHISMRQQRRLVADGIDFIFNFRNFESSRVLDDQEYLGKGFAGLEERSVEFIVHKYTDESKVFTELRYNNEIFREEEFLEELLSLIRQIVSKGVKKLSELAFVTETSREYQQILDWNSNAQDFDLNSCLHTLFEAQVKQYPSKIAAVHNGRSISYKELNSSANKLARYLREKGVSRNDLVGLCSERSISFLVAMLAIMKAGGAYVPIDPSYPKERIRFMLEDSEVDVLVSQKEFKDKVSVSEGQAIIFMDDCLQAIQNESEENLDVENEPSDRAYMIYTSGSTGSPKGALVRHNGALNHILAERQMLDIRGKIDFLQTAPSSSDISVWQFIAPIISGGKTVIASNLTNVKEIVGLINEYEVDIVELVPSILRFLIDEMEILDKSRTLFKKLKWMMVTGEAVSKTLVNSWLSAYPSIPVVNAYGPTEASDDIVQAVIREPITSTRLTVPIGRPLANLNIYILDEYQRILPIGVVGEICVSGVGVGEGYWNNEKDTKKSFVENPFKNTLGDVIYRTGDMGRWLPDGTLEYIGRFDQQVKLHGFRIELGEIESVLSLMEAVSEVAVTLWGDQYDNKQIVAYIVLSKDRQEEQDWRGELENRIPAHMVPSAFVIIESLPKTPSGKIDKNALPAPNSEEFSAKDYMPAQTALEKSLLNIWVKLLNISEEAIGTNDDFFRLGGHSLLAARMAAYIEEDQGVKVELKDVFSYPTIRQLAKRIKSKNNRSLEIAPVEIQFGQQVPLTYTQLDFWFMYFYTNNPWVLNNVSKIKGELNVNVFETALKELLKKHQIFSMQYSRWVPIQKYCKGIESYALIVNDLANLEKEKKKAKQKELVEEFVGKAINLKRSPNCDFLLIRLSEYEHIFCTKLSHLTVDAFAQNLFATELLQIYCKSTNAQFKERGLQISDYSKWERECFSEKKIVEEKQYWLDYLKDAKKLELPIEMFSTESGEYSHLISVTKKHERKICQLQEQHKCPLQVVLIAIVSIALNRMSGQDDFCIKYVSENRDTKADLNLMAPTMQERVIRIRLSEEDSYKSILETIKHDYFTKLEHRQLPWIIPLAILEKRHAPMLFHFSKYLIELLSRLFTRVFRNALLYRSVISDYMAFLDFPHVKNHIAIDVSINILQNTSTKTTNTFSESELIVEPYQFNTSSVSIPTWNLKSLNFEYFRDINDELVIGVYGGNLKPGIYRELASEIETVLKEI